jgi:hypothetical protein
MINNREKRMIIGEGVDNGEKRMIIQKRGL